MQSRDPHTALKSSIVKKINAGQLEIVLAMLQWGKDDKGYSLHVNPTAPQNLAQLRLGAHELPQRFRTPLMLPSLLQVQNGRPRVRPASGFPCALRLCF